MEVIPGKRYTLEADRFPKPGRKADEHITSTQKGFNRSLLVLVQTGNSQTAYSKTAGGRNISENFKVNIFQVGKFTRLHMQLSI